MMRFSALCLHPSSSSGLWGCLERKIKHGRDTSVLHFLTVHSLRSAFMLATSNVLLSTELRPHFVENSISDHFHGCVSGEIETMDNLIRKVPGVPPSISKTGNMASEEKLSQEREL